MFLIRLASFRNWLLPGVLLLVVLAVPVAQKLSFDQTIESFFPADHPDILLLKQTRRDFGGDEFVIVAWKQPKLLQQNPDGEFTELTPAAADRIKNLSQQLSQLPGVDGKRTRDLQLLLEKSPRNRNTRQAMLKLFNGMLIGPDQQTTAIVLQLLPASASTVSRDEAIQTIRKTVQALEPNAAVAGEPVQIQEMFDLVERDGNLLYIASLLVLSVILMLIFKGVRWVMASLLIVVGSVTCTRALLVLAGTQLSMVSSMLNSLVTIIAISTTTHIIVHYRELRTSEGLSAEPAMLQTLQTLWYPVFWTIVTIAVGFAALLVSNIVPVRSFAIMMTLGTLLVPLLILLVMPAAFASGKAVPVPGRIALEDQLDRLLNSLAHAIDRRPAMTTIFCILMVAVTAPGLMMMQVETDFSRNFRDSSPILQALRFVESELGPAGTWDVSFDAPAPLTNTFLETTHELTQRLKDLNSKGSTLDVVSLTDALNVPPRIGSATKRLDLIRRRQADLVESFYNPAEGRMRIVLRSVEQQPTADKLTQIRQVRQVVADHFQTHNLLPSQTTSESSPRLSQATASGLFVVMARIIESLLADQIRSFLWASLGTVVCMTIAFRSLRIGLISLVPNVFPIAIVTGALGLLNIPVNIGTAMIASVAMGFTCSVHYIAVFQKALPSIGISGALNKAQAEVGKAVVLAHIALVAGFLVLTFSEFIPLVYFGALLSLSMVGGLISDLVMLPLLLRWTTPAPLPSQPSAQ